MFRTTGYGYGPYEDQDFGGDDGPPVEAAFGAQDGSLYRPEGHDFAGNDHHDVHFAYGFQHSEQGHQHQQSIGDQRTAGISDPAMWHPTPFNGETPEQKKRRKNREAAARCQRRKKEQTEILRGDVEYLQQLVDQMKTVGAAHLPPMAVPPMAPMVPNLPRRVVPPLQTSTQQASSRLPAGQLMMPPPVQSMLPPMSMSPPTRAMLPPMQPPLVQPQANEPAPKQQDQNYQRFE